MLAKLNGQAFAKELKHWIGDGEWIIFRVVDEVVDLELVYETEITQKYTIGWGKTDPSSTTCKVRGW